MNTKNVWLLIGGGILVSLALVASTATTNFPFGGMMRLATSSVGNTGIEMPMMHDEAFEVATGAPSEEFRIIADDYDSVVTDLMTAGETAADVDQKVIKTGYLDLEVSDVGETASGISALAAGLGGFTQESSVSEREDGTHYGNVTVRVPADQFEQTMSKIKELATAVRTESSQGQDVTEQYTDLEAQLRNAKAQEEEFLRVLAQAKSVDDILEVQSYLSSVRSTIESLEGRVQYLENRTSYSTISVELSEETAVRLPTKDFRPWSAVREAAQTLVAVLESLAVAAIWLAIVGGGLLLPAGLVAWIAYRVLTRKRTR